MLRMKPPKRKLKLKEMKINKPVVFGVLVLSFMMVRPAQAANEAEVRGTVLRVFQQLKSRDYSALYDSLPSSSRARMTRVFGVCC